MPAFGDGYSDIEIAEVANYVTRVSEQRIASYREGRSRVEATNVEVTRPLDPSLPLNNGESPRGKT